MRHLEVWFAMRKKRIFFLFQPFSPVSPCYGGGSREGRHGAPVCHMLLAGLVNSRWEMEQCLSWSGSAERWAQPCSKPITSAFFPAQKTWRDPGGAVWGGEETCCIPHPAVTQPHGQDCSESLRSISWQEKSGFYCVPPPQPVASMASEPPAGGAVRHRQRGGREPPAAHAVFPTWRLLPAVCHKQNKFCLVALKLNLF